MSSHHPESGRSVSRTQKKRDAQAVEDLARELMELSLADVDSLPLGGECLEVVREGLRLAAHGARKRHLKYLARNLRGLSPDEMDILRNHMAERHGSHQAEVQREKYVSGLRDRLLLPEACEEALSELERQYPGPDLGGIRELVRANLKVPRRSYSREMYRLVVSFMERARRLQAR